MKVAELQKYMAVFQNSTLHKIIVKEQKANKQKLKNKENRKGEDSNYVFKIREKKGKWQTTWQNQEN